MVESGIPGLDAVKLFLPYILVYSQDIFEFILINIKAVKVKVIYGRNSAQRRFDTACAAIAAFKSPDELSDCRRNQAR